MILLLSHELGIGSITRKWLIPDGNVVTQSLQHFYTCRVPISVIKQSGAEELLDTFRIWIGPGKIFVGTPFPDFYDLHIHHPSNNLTPAEDLG